MTRPVSLAAIVRELAPSIDARAPFTPERCPICGAVETENAKGRLEMHHDGAKHRAAEPRHTPTPPLQRPARTGWADEDDE